MHPTLALRAELRDPLAKEARLARIEELENEVFEKSVQVVNALLDWTQVTHDQKEPPPEWIEQWGLEGARQRLAIAKSAWLPQAVMPGGGKLALQAMTGISRGRAWKLKITNNQVNVKIALPAPTTEAHPGPITYEVRDLEP